MQSADVQTDLEQNTESQTAGDTPAHTSLETLEQSELDWDPYELFSASEDSAANNTDTAADSPMLSEGIENTEAFEQSFLSGLQSDEESGIMQVERQKETGEPAQTAKAAEQAQKPLTAQERLALLGAALLEKGGMPSPKQLSAMGMDAPTARGIQSLVWLATEGDPAARRKVEAMIDQIDDESETSRLQNSGISPFSSEIRIDSPEETAPELYLSESAMVDSGTIDGKQVVWDDGNSGIVEFKAPPNATPEQIAQVRAYVDGCNNALKAGKLSKTGRVSTKGSLRDQASDAAKKEARRAKNAGTPYRGHVSHVPDTTWTGTPEPYSWLDLDPVVNTSLGGQVKRYPIGYKPTGFVFKEDE